MHAPRLLDKYQLKFGARIKVKEIQIMSITLKNEKHEIIESKISMQLLT